MEKDRIKWNKRHNNSSCPELPSEIVKKYCSLARNKKALDIASGTGRNALFLAESGLNELLHSFLCLKIICYKEKTGKSRHGPACIASLAGINRMK